MNQIRLQFVLGAGIGSRLIAWWGNGYGGFSHVDAIMADKSCIGARSDKIGLELSGVQRRPAGYEKWVNRRVASLDVKPEEYKAWEDYLIQQVNLPYDKGDIIGLIIGRDLSEKGHWICSELQTAALQRVSRLPLALPVPPQQVTPNSLLLMVAAVGFKMS